MATTEPQKWSATLGANADVNSLPATTPAGSGRASTSGLFPQITQKPLDEGGIAPERADFNALFKYLGDYIYYVMQGGVFSYLSTYEYTAGNLVAFSGAVYECIAANGPGNVHAPTDTAYWRQLALSEIHSQGGAGGFGWVRFKSGLQIVFSSGTADEVLNFPVAFIAEPRLVMTSPTTGGTYVGVPGWYERTNTYFKGNVYDPENHEFVNDGHFDYIAIGFWK